MYYNTYHSSYVFIKLHTAVTISGAHGKTWSVHTLSQLDAYAILGPTLPLYFYSTYVCACVFNSKELTCWIFTSQHTYVVVNVVVKNL